MTRTSREQVAGRRVAQAVDGDLARVWLTPRWTVFGEPGLYVFHGVYDDYCNGVPGCVYPTRTSVQPALYLGGRFHFNEKVSLTMRVGYPTDLDRRVVLPLIARRRPTVPLRPRPAPRIPRTMKACTFVRLVVVGLVVGCGSDPKQVEAPAAPATPAASAPTGAAPPPQARPAAAPAPKLTMPEMQKKALLALESTYNARDTKAYADLYAEGGTLITLGAAGFVEEGKGRPGIAGALAAIQEQADVQVKVTRVLLRDELALYEWVMAGTDKASGKKASVRGASVVTFDSDGKITKDYGYSDQLTRAILTGAMPGRAREVVLPAGEATFVQAKKEPAEDKQADVVRSGWPAAWTKKDKKLLEAVVTDDVVFENVAQPADTKSKAEVVKVFDAMSKAVPDAEITVDPVWAAGAFVVSSFTVKGTQKGSFGAAQKVTNKPFVIHGLDVSELRGGKIARTTWYTNGAELLGQLGLLPKKEEKKPAPAKK